MFRTALASLALVASVSAASAQTPVQVVNELTTEFAQQRDIRCPKARSETMCRLQFFDLIGKIGIVNANLGNLMLAIHNGEQAKEDAIRRDNMKLLGDIAVQSGELYDKYPK